MLRLGSSFLFLGCPKKEWRITKVFGSKKMRSLGFGAHTAHFSLISASFFGFFKGFLCFWRKQRKYHPFFADNIFLTFVLGSLR